MGDRTTQATTTTKTTAEGPPSRKSRENARALYGSSVTKSGTDSNDAAPLPPPSPTTTTTDVNRSPWNIGLEFYDQRDSFTTTSSIDHDGYGIGPSVHPEEGSLAAQYQRHARPRGHHTTSATNDKPTWMFVHEPARNEHHNHDGFLPDGRYAKVQHQGHHYHHHQGIWDRIKDALHLEHHDGKQGERTQRQILIDVETALARREDLDSSDIEVSVHTPHEVTLEGTVVDRHSKRIAEEVCEGVQGVRDVQNRLKIRDDDPTDANVAFVLPLTLLGR